MNVCVIGGGAAGMLVVDVGERDAEEEVVAGVDSAVICATVLAAPESVVPSATLR